MRRYFHSKSLVFLLFALVTLHRFWAPWGPNYNNADLIKWDVYGYYLYLPATLIHHDPAIRDMKWFEDLGKKYTPSDTYYQITFNPDGSHTIRYPLGMAILWSPFFLTAHMLAEPLGYPADGLSPPYSYAILIGDLIYALIGLWFLRKVLKYFFSDGITMIVMILITMGTNYWAQIASDTIMPHSNLFTVAVLILWWTIRWHETLQWKYALLLGFALGVATVSRPTEIIWMIVPLFWTVRSWSTFRSKMLLLVREWKQVLLLGAAMFSVLFLQMSYWHYTSGKWIFYTYDAHFSLGSPFILKSLFSYKKGWFIYTPLMFFAFFGFIFIWKNKRELFIPLLLFVIANCWVIMSWECWWYAACFSNRALVEMYPAMAIPLGFLIVYLSGKAKPVVRYSISPVIGFCLFLNLFQHWQYNHGLLDGERITRAYYWRMFLKTSATDEDRKLLEFDHWPQDEHLYDLKSVKRVAYQKMDFDRVVPENFTSIDTVAPKSGKRAFRLPKDVPFSPIFARNFRETTSKDYLWGRCQVWVRYDSAFAGKEPPVLVFSFEANGISRKYKAVPLDTAGLKPGEWRMLTTDYVTPLELYAADRISCYVWNRSPVPVSIDDFEVSLFEPLTDN